MTLLVFLWVVGIWFTEGYIEGRGIRSKYQTYELWFVWPCVLGDAVGNKRD